jgi:hypothetical protein
MPEAPDSVSFIGCDAANGTYVELYSDERNVCRIYQMSSNDGVWKRWRDGEPFPQRFTAQISPDGNTIDGRWEKARPESGGGIEQLNGSGIADRHIWDASAGRVLTITDLAPSAQPADDNAF